MIYGFYPTHWQQDGGLVTTVKLDDGRVVRVCGEGSHADEHISDEMWKFLEFVERFGKPLVLLALALACLVGCGGREFTVAESEVLLTTGGGAALPLADASAPEVQPGDSGGAEHQESGLGGDSDATTDAPEDHLNSDVAQGSDAPLDAHDASDAPATCPGGEPFHCCDGILDSTESDIDCGGGSCVPCPTGDRCFSPGDCQTAVCTSNICG